ncbi:hypothetical protein LCGC14_1463380 [marine sediment metagenome]|uniref:Uncharacterized protein n=1 Tax=marine sediment metagenome TaxID=412755 RepID=A0A0F9JEX8_9ZZZZ
MGLGGTLRRFANVCVRVERDAGYFDNGRWINADPERFEFQANVQPSTARTIERLPEGSRSQGAKTIYPAPGSGTLRTADAGDDGYNADQVTIDGRVYEIAMVEAWRQHTSYVATRLGQ